MHSFDYDISDILSDPSGRFVLIRILIENRPLILLNIYAPNDQNSHYQFLDHINTTIQNYSHDVDTQIICGGDFNYTPNIALDRRGGNPRVWSRSNTSFSSFLQKYDLVDIWRIRNPTVQRFTWRRGVSTPVQSRLDYFLISDSMQHIVNTVDIVPVSFSDHSCVFIKLSSQESIRGPSFWKFNTSLLDDIIYVNEMQNLLNDWLSEIDNYSDLTIFWDYLKYKIRKFTVRYSKSKAKQRKDNRVFLENKLKDLDILCCSDPSIVNLEQYNQVKTELDLCNDYITRGQSSAPGHSGPRVVKKVLSSFWG